MNRLIGPAGAAACVLILFLACFGGVLFRGELFGYRDAAHYYYPLYQRVQQEWAKGRLPLWDAQENGGMPLLGNPTAAVLYPGKLVYATMPYPWAARVYTIAHVALALAGMYRLLRVAGASREGSCLAAMSYAFGAPILFQYCNIIYLVGAAWVPWGLAAADRWLRSGRRWALPELAGVLAMQVLGGDPQVAYGIGLCAGGYAIGMAIARRRHLERRPPIGRFRAVLLWGIGLTAWVAVVLFCAWYLPRFRSPRTNPPAVPFFWSRWTPLVVAGSWAAIGAAWLAWRRRADRVLPAMLGGLAGAAVLAGLLSAIQLLPIYEYTSRTVRSAEDGPHDIFPFSLEPYRLLEFLWPDLFGSGGSVNRSWGAFLPPRHSTEVWVPTVYLGMPTILLAISAFGFRGADARRCWFGAIALVGVAASLGQFGSPLWVARNIPAAAEVLGPHDPMDVLASRLDGKLRDGDGGVYSIMATFLPGFGSFRYPSKMLTFACVGICGLAGLGFDRAMNGRWRRVAAVAAGVATFGLAGLVAVWIGHGPFVATLKATNDEKALSPFGPLDYEAAWRSCFDALGYGLVLAIAASVAIVGARRRPRLASAATLALLTADLIATNASLVITVPQRVLEGKPEVLKRIEEAEAADPSPGPFRVHRVPYWDPLGWGQAASSTRFRDMVEWERRTLQPKYGLPFGVSYTMTLGVGELYDYEWFFQPFLGNSAYPLQPFDAVTNPKLIYFPRRGFDLWNTRYFILPARTSNDSRRGIFSFLPETEPVFPDSRGKSPEAWEPFFNRWSKVEDWQVVRNKNMFPRSWIVHSADSLLPIVGLNRSGRENVMTDMLYLGDRYWTVPQRQVRDLRRMAFVETDDPSTLQSFLSNADLDPEETAEVVSLDDQRVEIRAVLKSNGMVVLSDVIYPGWELTIDGEPATIYRTNRLMRGAAVEAGEHTLVYQYRPKSVALGAAISIAGLIGMMATAFFCFRRPSSSRLEPFANPGVPHDVEAIATPPMRGGPGVPDDERVGPDLRPAEGPAGGQRAGLDTHS